MEALTHAKELTEVEMRERIERCNRRADEAINAAVEEKKDMVVAYQKTLESKERELKTLIVGKNAFGPAAEEELKAACARRGVAAMAGPFDGL